MKVLEKYLVVEKFVEDKGLQLSSRYIDEYQMCTAVFVDKDSNIAIGDKILVGNKICFDRAEFFGSDAYYIHADDVFGVIKNGTIIPREDIVYIEADKHSKSKLVVNGIEFYNETSYNPFAPHNVTQDGIVLSVCDKAKDSYFFKPLRVEVSTGDHVYTHHFLTDTDNEREFNGKKYYETRYENLYCKVASGKIIMLNEWNFISSVEKDLEQESGVILETLAKKESKRGIVTHLSQSLKDKGIKEGDKIIFKRGREYRIDVEGTEYYRIETNDILYKL